MRLHYLQHIDFEGLGEIAGWAESRGYEVSRTKLYEGEAVPSPSDLDLLVVMGGPMGVHDRSRSPWLAQELRFIETIVRNDIPVLGVCLGAQLVADVLGGRVYPHQHKEIGWFPVRFGAEAQDAFSFLPEEAYVFQWHGDTFELPDGALPLARSEACENQGFVFDDNILALQFHLEMTPAGTESLLDRCRFDLKPGPYVQTAEQIRGNGLAYQKARELLYEMLDGFFGTAGTHRKN